MKEARDSAGIDSIRYFALCFVALSFRNAPLCVSAPLAESPQTMEKTALDLVECLEQTLIASSGVAITEPVRDLLPNLIARLAEIRQAVFPPLAHARRIQNRPVFQIQREQPGMFTGGPLGRGRQGDNQLEACQIIAEITHFMHRARLVPGQFNADLMANSDSVTVDVKIAADARRLHINPLAEHFFHDSLSHRRADRIEIAAEKD